MVAHEHGRSGNGMIMSLKPAGTAEGDNGLKIKTIK